MKEGTEENASWIKSRGLRKGRSKKGGWRLKEKKWRLAARFEKRGDHCPHSRVAGRPADRKEMGGISSTSPGRIGREPFAKTRRGDLLAVVFLKRIPLCWV